MMFIVFLLLAFPCGILGQVWYLIVSFPDLCLLSYFFLSLAQSFANVVSSQLKQPFKFKALDI